MPDTKVSADQLASSVGACIVDHRERAGLDGATLARAAGMAPAYLWRVEQGRSLPSLRNLARLAKALDVSLSALLAEADISSVPLDNRPYERG